MIVSTCRMNDSTEISLVAFARDCFVELYSILDNNNVIELVADFHFDSMVLDVHITHVHGHLLLSSVTTHGVGFSWINRSSWRVSSTRFQEIIHTTASSHHPTTTSTTTGVTESTWDGGDISDGSIVYLDHSQEYLVTIGSLIYLSTDVYEYDCDIFLCKELPLMTNIGTTTGTTTSNGTTGNTAISYSSLIRPAASTGPGGGLGVSMSTNLTASLNGSNNNSTHSADPILVHKAYTIASPTTDNTVLFQAYHKSNKYMVLQWCELESSSTSTTDNGSISTMHPGETRQLVDAIEASGDALPSDKPAKTKNRKQESHNDTNNKLLRVLWEVNLPSGAVIQTEPHNNDGQDSRKLCYVSLPMGVVQLYNVNGRVCQYDMSSILTVGYEFLFYCTSLLSYQINDDDILTEPPELCSINSYTPHVCH